MNPGVLQVKDLHVHYHTPAGPVKAVNGVSFTLEKGRRLGLVGESGSGKSTTALAILRLINPPGIIEAGEVRLDNQDLLNFSPEKMRQVRFDKISLIPQGAMNSLNPVLKIRDQIEDIAMDHGGWSAQKELRDRIPDLLDQVGLKAAVANMFPHELSGGMKQRVCIAMAITLRPQVIIADEPTSALDVVVQRQVIQTLAKIQADLQASVILVGHDMGIMAQFVDDIGIMYAGELIEVGKVGEIYREPLHPYTQLLISCIPSLDAKRQFMGIPGVAPSLLSPPAGCPFHPRCPQVMERCAQQKPSLKEIHPGRWVSCFLYEDKHSG